MKKISLYKLDYDWYIIQNSKEKWCLVGGNELLEIIKNETSFFEKYFISTFKTKKALIEHFKRESYYRHLFK